MTCWTDYAGVGWAILSMLAFYVSSSLVVAGVWRESETSDPVERIALTLAIFVYGALGIFFYVLMLPHTPGG